MMSTLPWSIWIVGLAGCALGGTDEDPEREGTLASTDWFEYLGPPSSGTLRTSPRHGIRYNDHGFSACHEADIDAGVVYLREQFASPDPFVAEFVDFAGRMTRSPERDQVGQWIDDAFDVMVARYVACGASGGYDWAGAATATTPGSFDVEVMSTGFLIPGWESLGRVAGAFLPSTSRIMALNVYVSQSELAVKRFDRLMQWEIGNMLAYRAGWRTGGDVSLEKGHRSPCGLALDPDPSPPPAPPATQCGSQPSCEISVVAPSAGAIVHRGEAVTFRVTASDCGTLTSSKVKWPTSVGAVKTRLAPIDDSTFEGQVVVPDAATLGTNRPKVFIWNHLDERIATRAQVEVWP